MYKGHYIILNEGDVKNIVSYLRSIGGVQVLPCDDPVKGIKGAMCFHTLDKGIPNDSPMYEERELILGYQFAKPVEEEDRVVLDVNYEGREDTGLADKEYIESQLTPIIETLGNCLTEDGWGECDDPKRLRMGSLSMPIWIAMRKADGYH